MLLCLDTCVDNSPWLFPPAGIKKKTTCLSHLSSPLMPSTVLSRTAKVSSSTSIITALSIRFVLLYTVFLVEPVRSPDCKMVTWKRIHYISGVYPKVTGLHLLDYFGSINQVHIWSHQSRSKMRRNWPLKPLKYKIFHREPSGSSGQLLASHLINAWAVICHLLSQCKQT